MPTTWIPTFCCFGHPWSWWLVVVVFGGPFNVGFFKDFYSADFRVAWDVFVSFDKALFGKVTVGGTKKKLINTFNSFFGDVFQDGAFLTLQEAMILLNESLLDWCTHHHLTQPMAKLSTFWDHMFSRKKRFKLLSQGPVGPVGVGRASLLRLIFFWNIQCWDGWIASLNQSI